VQRLFESQSCAYVLDHSQELHVGEVDYGKASRMRTLPQSIPQRRNIEVNYHAVPKNRLPANAF
jgi:hypothetical protein